MRSAFLGTKSRNHTLLGTSLVIDQILPIVRSPWHCVLTLGVSLHLTYPSRRSFTKVRGALVGSVFRKMLMMDTASSTYSSGQLTNLMSVDAQGVLEYSCYTHFIWATSLQVRTLLPLVVTSFPNLTPPPSQRGTNTPAVSSQGSVPLTICSGGSASAALRRFLTYLCTYSSQLPFL